MASFRSIMAVGGALLLAGCGPKPASCVRASTGNSKVSWSSPKSDNYCAEFISIRQNLATDEQVGLGAWMADQPPPLVPNLLSGYWDCNQNWCEWRDPRAEIATAIMEEAQRRMKESMGVETK